MEPRQRLTLLVTVATQESVLSAQPATSVILLVSLRQSPVESAVSQTLELTHARLAQLATSADLRQPEEMPLLAGMTVSYAQLAMTAVKPLALTTLQATRTPFSLAHQVTIAWVEPIQRQLAQLEPTNQFMELPLALPA